MLKNYIKSALRNLIRQKLYTVINVLGLAIGLAACLLIIGYVNNELSFENCHRNKDRIYRIDGVYALGNSRVSMASIMPAVGLAVREAFPEIERVVRIRRLWTVPLEFTHGGIVEEREGLAAEPDLLKIFTLPLKEGNPQTALEAPFSVVISEELANLHFGDQSALGRTIRARDEFDLQVTGVFQSIPANTQLKTDFVISYSTLDKIGMDTQSWTELFQDYTYVFLREGANPAEVEQKIPALLKQNLDEDKAENYILQLQPLKRIYLHSNLSYELPPSGDPVYIYIFGCVAFLILLIACINFINLSTARVSHRLREVGVRKVLGALRFQLVKQFLSESILLTVTAMVFGIALFEMAKPRLEAFIEQQLEINVWSDPVLLLSMFAMIIVVGVLSGSYPAFVLTRFQPSFILRGEILGTRSKSFLRRILVAFQFVIAIALLCVTFAVYKQINYALTSDLGFDNQDMLLINAEEGVSPEKQDLIKDEILRSGLVSSVTVTDCAPGEPRHNLYGLRAENRLDQDPTFLHGMRVDQDYLKTFGIQLVKGRDFSAEFATDAGNSILINQVMIKEYDIEEPIGFKFYLGDKAYEIVGVVRDFYTHSFHEQILPIGLFAATKDRRLIAAKLPPDFTSHTVAEIERIWIRIVPEIPFEYSFLEDVMSENYKDDRRLGILFTIFSLLTVFVACLGLFGLAAFSAERRTKEIGIRKALGASVTGIIRLLCREIVILVVIANAVAWPVAYLAIGRWLETFAYRTDITLTIFILSGLLVLFIALATVGYQSIKAALANPVDSLRYE
jgi:putative ABC transport system permease protein